MVIYIKWKTKEKKPQPFDRKINDIHIICYSYCCAHGSDQIHFFSPFYTSVEQNGTLNWHLPDGIIVTRIF